MRPLTILAFAVAVAMCGKGSSPAVPSAVPGNALVADVVRGGSVLFFRHAARDASAISNEDLARTDRTGGCAPGSELTSEGTADARAIGAAFRDLEIPVGRVIASPTCRTKQMAQLAFGAHEEMQALLYPEAFPENEGENVPELRRLLSTPPRPGTATVLVSHNNVLVPGRTDLDLTLDQAEAAVLRPLGDRVELVGRIKKSEWVAQAAGAANAPSGPVQRRTLLPRPGSRAAAWTIG